MMKTPRLQAHKLERLIKVHGVCYTFKRDKLDEFKEPSGAVSEMTVRGVFHQLTQHISIVSSDAASVQQKNSPYIIALYCDAQCLEQGDKVTINGTKYKVNALTDIAGWNLAMNISLEAVV